MPKGVYHRTALKAVTNGEQVNPPTPDDCDKIYQAKIREQQDRIHELELELISLYRRFMNAIGH